ncbi:DinB superfamily protein [Phycisphaerae bacterium RAS1]|nr:DinB superfamily protein [Phycisphaerae bacterium RAS1]
MNVRAALKGQYRSALAMLRRAIEPCPPELWDGGGYPTPFWRVAYHTLYFADLYLQPTLASFKPWELHRDDYHDLPWPPGSGPAITDPYTPAQLLEYWARVNDLIDAAVDRLDLDAPESGIPWHQSMPKLEHQLHNIRHIQHHAAMLSGRLRLAGEAEVEWVRSK